jgi:hypothetical protein
LNSTDLIPSVETPVENLYLATTAQIYPALTNGESVSRHASQAAQIVLGASLSPALEPAVTVGRVAPANSAAL